MSIKQHCGASSMESEPTNTGGMCYLKQLLKNVQETVFYRLDSV